jgi:hypothetical protein
VGSHAWQRFKRSKGVKLTGILEYNPQTNNEHLHRPPCSRHVVAKGGGRGGAAREKHRTPPSWLAPNLTTATSRSRLVGVRL